MKQKILVSLMQAEQSYQRRQADAARAAAARAGMELEVLFTGFSASDQSQKLLERIHAPEHARPDCIVAMPAGPDGLARAAQEAAQAGIGWVLLSTHPYYLDFLRRQYPKVAISAVVIDQIAIGRIQAQQLQALLPNGGKLVLLEGPTWSNSVINRRQGMSEGIRGSKIEVMKTLAGDWTEESGESAVAFWLVLATEKPAALVCQNDSMAVGARKAILEKKPEWADVPLIGCDGLPEEGLRMVKEGTLAATVVMPVTAATGVDLLAGAAQGKPVPPTTSFPVESYPRIEELKRRHGGSADKA